MRSLTNLRRAWGARPGSYSPVVWALILALDALPWPWGEEILAGCFVARTFVRRGRFRQALAWARAQPDSSVPPRRLARALCAYHGRFVARSALVGMRDPDTVRRHVAVRGEEHLAAAGTGANLLGFHLGPAQSYLALRARGHHLIWVGGRGASPGWAPAIRERYQRDHGDLLLPDVPYAWERRLYTARQILKAGRSVFISADGAGAMAFSVPLPGGPAAIGTGWLLLRQSTKAPVLPVLSHLEGRTQVVTAFPRCRPASPIPPATARPAGARSRM